MFRSIIEIKTEKGTITPWKDRVGPPVSNGERGPRKNNGDGKWVLKCRTIREPQDVVMDSVYDARCFKRALEEWGWFVSVRARKNEPIIVQIR